MYYQGKTNEYLNITTIDASNCYLLKEPKESCLTLLWCLNDATELSIDGRLYQFKKNQIICLTEFHKVTINTLGALRMIQFNRSFYCILDHDSEVSCKGILFFGASQLPVLDLPQHQVKKFSGLWEVFESELSTEPEDDLQLEMLQILLKRLLILCTRMYKDQHNYAALADHPVDLVREFNFLVEKHFKSKHTVAEYAALLNKSPKTISNLFSKLNTKTPLHFIQDRIMLEARRLLRYTDQSIKEIAYDLGYEDIQSFSRFFKKNEGSSPSDFKKNTFQDKLTTP